MQWPDQDVLFTYLRQFSVTQAVLCIYWDVYASQRSVLVEDEPTACGAFP